jgi:acyl-CoA synthetase (AMP-forming)/AMP-acid ligase II
MTTSSRISSGAAGLGPLALALAEESVRSHHDDALTEKALSAAASALRQVNLEAGRRALVTAADKAVAGAAVAAAFQLAAASAQFAAASATATQATCLAANDPGGARLAEVSAKTMEATAALSTAFAKSGDIIAATGQYDQARKTMLDKSAEALQQEIQDAERARTAAKDAATRELATMKDLVELQRDAARAAIRA